LQLIEARGRVVKVGDGLVQRRGGQVGQQADELTERARGTSRADAR
jgi:hypothetical protein